MPLNLMPFNSIEKYLFQTDMNLLNIILHKLQLNIIEKTAKLIFHLINSNSSNPANTNC